MSFRDDSISVLTSGFNPELEIFVYLALAATLGAALIYPYQRSASASIVVSIGSGACGAVAHYL
jgi:hypothetical protein